MFMGLAGGPHCVAMCGAACGALKSTPESPYLPVLFHGGRLIGYASLGAVAAASVGGLAWFSDQTLALKPVWTFFHVAILCWGIVLLATARQPQWADRYGRVIWKWARKGTSTSTGANAVGGAVTMGAFALGTTASLLLAPWLWLRIRQGKLGLHESTGMRLAGLLLVAAAGWAIWMDLTHGIKVWCS
jgi:sulfite exporter TauE/SafE